MVKLNHSLLLQLQRLPLETRHSMIGTVSGKHRSALRGSSVEFAEYREYVKGDDTRRLDWKAYARSDRYYIKEFEADTNLRLYFVIDTSGSMDFTSNEVESKYARACYYAAHLAYLALNQGDAVSMTWSARQPNGNSYSYIPPSRRGAHMNVLLNHVHTQPPQGETTLCECLHELAERVPRRALFIILSDLFTNIEEWKKALQHLKYRKHDVAVFHFVNQLEIKFDFDRPMKFVDMEGSDSLIVEPDIIAEEYRRIISRFLKDSQEICNNTHVDYFMVGSTDNPQATLTQFLTQRLMHK